MLRALRGWGANPLPSPPGGGRADWGARAPRIGSSCGPWGPWRAAHLGCWADPCSAVGSCRGARAVRRRSAVPAPRKIAATREGSALGPGGLDRGARLRPRARRPCPGIAVPAPRLRATRLERGVPAPGLRSPRVSVGCPRPRSTSFYLPSLCLLPLRASASAGCTPQVPTLGSQPVPSARDWRLGARREGLGESGQ